VLVPPGRLEAVLQLVAAIQAGQSDAPRIVQLEDPETGKLLPLVPIEIAPVEIAPLASLGPDPSGGL
jgi:hypothetical protein